jgi:hypothetical protein
MRFLRGNSEVVLRTHEAPANETYPPVAPLHHRPARHTCYNLRATSMLATATTTNDCRLMAFKVGIINELAMTRGAPGPYGGHTLT